jgi:hypothetical protein
MPETELLKPLSDLLHRGSAPGLSGLNPLAPQVYPQWVQRWSRADLTACAAGSGPAAERMGELGKGPLAALPPRS